MFPQIFGKYVLEREIAAGGMARVYLATLRGAVGFREAARGQTDPARARVDEPSCGASSRKPRPAVELSHPNIVPVYELGVEQGIYYIAMELATG